jgi:hypothetical protein
VSSHAEFRDSTNEKIVRMSDIEHDENEDQHAADEPQPEHEPDHVLPDDSDSDVLSDLDDEIFDDYNTTQTQIKEPIPIDEDTIPTLGKYKKKTQAGAEGPPKDKKRRRREKFLKDDEEHAAAPIVEVELTAEESKCHRHLCIHELVCG